MLNGASLAQTVATSSISFGGNGNGTFNVDGAGTTVTNAGGLTVGLLSPQRVGHGDILQRRRLYRRHGDPRPELDGHA
ncbi:MAG: hypothetical protein WDN72_02420 [Alphaproteobacteria bacterium]